LSHADVEQLRTREDISLRERNLWRMLYETAARSAELFVLSAEDLDRPAVRPGAPQGRRHRRHRPARVTRRYRRRIIEPEKMLERSAAVAPPRRGRRGGFSGVELNVGRGYRL